MSRFRRGKEFSHAGVDPATDGVLADRVTMETRNDRAVVDLSRYSRSCVYGVYWVSFVGIALDTEESLEKDTLCSEIAIQLPAHRSLVQRNRHDSHLWLSYNLVSPNKDDALEESELVLKVVMRLAGERAALLQHQIVEAAFLSADPPTEQPQEATLFSWPERD